jgi:hypothetical protein
MVAAGLRARHVDGVREWQASSPAAVRGAPMTVRFVDDRDVVFRALAIAALVAAVAYVALRVADLSLAYELMLGRRYSLAFSDPLHTVIILARTAAPFAVFAVEPL